MQRICEPFFRIDYLLFVCRFCQPARFFLLLDLHWDSPKLPWGIQRTCVPFVLKTIIMPYKTIFVLWHSLIRSSLYFYTSDIFRPILALFTHLHQFFLMYITTRIFLLSLMTLLLGIKLLFLISAVKGLVWSIFFFLTFIVLILWNFPWNISANLLIFTNKVSSYVVIV